MESGKTHWTIDISDRDSDAAVARINAELADIFARRGDTQAVYVTFDFEFSAYFYNVAKMTLLPHRGFSLEDKAGNPVGVIFIEADMDVMKLHEYQGAEGIAIDFFKPKEVEAGVEAMPLR